MSVQALLVITEEAVLMELMPTVVHVRQDSLARIASKVSSSFKDRFGRHNCSTNVCTDFCKGDNNSIFHSQVGMSSQPANYCIVNN